MLDKYVIGVDFGSDSVRAVAVNGRTGEIVSMGEAFYPRWKQGLYQHPEQSIFRQHPLDYLEAFEKCMEEALSALSERQRADIVGIGIDTTGSTVVPVDRDGVPLSLQEAFQDNENAMFQLWKDHSAFAQAKEVNDVFSTGSTTDYTKYQGTYSAEWFWAKILHTIREDASIRKAAYTWVEHCDWMVGILRGETKPETMYHSACAAGHKALWHSEWQGLPHEEVLEKLDPYLVQVKERFGNPPLPGPIKTGTLCREWAHRLGLKETVCVSGGSFDAHAGAVGAGIRERTLVCTIGTSAVDMLVVKADDLAGKNVRNYCGQAENSILPGYVGVEMGQAAFGDIFAWFQRLLLWPVKELSMEAPDPENRKIYEFLEKNLLTMLQERAKSLPAEPFPVSLDWFNGRRYPDTDDFQRAMLGNLSLGVDAPYLYRSLVFGAVSGLKRLVECFVSQGIPIDRVIAVGGISRKSDFVMQMMADVLGMNIEILDASQTCALGAAIYASVAGGLYEDVEAASRQLAAKSVHTFVPDDNKKDYYDKHYQEYLLLAEMADSWKGKEGQNKNRSNG